MALQPDIVVVRVRSHRARQKLFAMIGRTPQGYWTWESSGYYELTRTEWARFEEARKEGQFRWHSSVTRSLVDRADLRECWK